MNLSMADAANVLTLLDGNNEFLILPSSLGTFLVYPAWPHLELALGFLLKENVETVEKAYQNAQRYAFSMLFDTEEERENNPQLNLEAKLCTLHFYMNRLFGVKRETNATAQILMIANLMGCQLHEMSVSHINVTLDEREMERLGAYLCCVFMTLRRYNGKVSACEETDENPSFLTHVPQEYGIRIQQSIVEKVTKHTAFDLPTKADIASFATHPVFTNYKMEETNGALRLHLPLQQKALLSSLTARCGEQELTLILFPI